MLTHACIPEGKSHHSITIILSLRELSWNVTAKVKPRALANLACAQCRDRNCKSNLACD